MITSNKAKFGYNANPRLSANQLSEYLTASSPRRKSIIRDAKFPGTVVVARYDAAKDALTKHLCDPLRRTDVLSNAILDLTRKAEFTSATDWTRGNCLCCIEAIARFQRASNKLGLSGISLRMLPNRQPPLIIAGVNISVSLDMVAERKSRDGTRNVGGVILLISKGSQSSKNRADRCQAAAVLALLATQQNLASSGIADPKLCLSVDIFEGRTYFAKGNYKRIASTIESSCDEIADRWASIKPPDGYDGPDPN